MTSSFLDRNIVIASVQTDGDHYSPTYEVGQVPPSYRPNGGDLRAGDVWYDTKTDIYYSYTGVTWVPVGGPGVVDPLLNKIAEIESRLSELEDK